MTLEDAGEEPEEKDDQTRPALSHKNRLAMYPVQVTSEEKLQKMRLEIMQAAHDATSIFDLQMLHAKMDSILGNDE